MQQRQKVHRGKSKPFREVMGSLTGLDGEQTALLIRMGGAYIGKFRCKDPNRPVRDGDLTAAYFRLPLVMEPISFDPAWITARRHGLILANKPPGIPTQGRRDADYMAFYELLKQHVQGYVGLHHRLDQGTSGAMVFVADKGLNQDMAAVFRDRLVKKTYLAVAAGPWTFSEDRVTLDGPIAAERGRGPARYVVRGDGKPAVSHVRRLGGDRDVVFLSIRPETGRTHQIRVHLAHAGMPIAGDTFYGGPDDDHLFLHCAELRWPTRGKLLADGFSAAVPAHWYQTFPAFTDAWSAEENAC